MGKRRGDEGVWGRWKGGGGTADGDRRRRQRAAAAAGAAAPPRPPHPIARADPGVGGHEPSIGLAAAFLASREGFLQLARAAAQPWERGGRRWRRLGLVAARVAHAGSDAGAFSLVQDFKYIIQLTLWNN